MSTKKQVGPSDANRVITRVADQERPIEVSIMDAPRYFAGFEPFPINDHMRARTCWSLTLGPGPDPARIRIVDLSDLLPKALFHRASQVLLAAAGARAAGPQGIETSDELGSAFAADKDAPLPLPVRINQRCCQLDYGEAAKDFAGYNLFSHAIQPPIELILVRPGEERELFTGRL